MSSVSTLICSAALTMSLTACAATIENVERSAPPPDSFAAALKSGYVALARAEHDENDFRDADYFADRAARAAAGRAPLPPQLSDRRIPPEALPALAAARKHLMSALDNGARTATPGAAAHAQLAFDCWMQEQEENFQSRDIAACRGEFETALAQLAPESRSESRPHGTALTVRPAALTGTEAAPALKTRYVVYFDFDADRLTADAEGEVSRAAAAARLTGAAMVRVVGHADRAGPDGHNMTLSRSRAYRVVGALRRLGLPDVGVATQALGEERPAVATPDGARERLNRRVEIELTH